MKSFLPQRTQRYAKENQAKNQIWAEIFQYSCFLYLEDFDFPLRTFAPFAVQKEVDDV